MAVAAADDDDDDATDGMLYLRVAINYTKIARQMKSPSAAALNCGRRGRENLFAISSSLLAPSIIESSVLE